MKENIVRNNIVIGYTEESCFYTLRNVLGILNGYALGLDIIQELVRRNIQHVFIKHRMQNPEIVIYTCPLTHFTNTRFFVGNPLNSNERVVRITDMIKLNIAEIAEIHDNFW